MTREFWTDEYLDRMRWEGDREGDDLANAILSPITPAEVEEHLDDLISRQLELKNHPPEDAEEAQRHLRLRTIQAEFYAGTTGVLESLKVATSAMRSAAIGFGRKDPATANRFQEITLALLKNAQEALADAARGDEDWFTSKRKREAFNYFLMLSEILAIAPELISSPQSEVARKMSLYPAGFLNFFAPVPAPGWVDEKKLELANEIWEENMLFALLVLFSGSLPYCYLDKKGIPTLYKTGKLLDEPYISQRLYETGLMLDSVMSRGGIVVMHEEGEKGRRFLSGKGVLYARKVRLLHSAMRHMALVDPHGHSQEVDASGGRRWQVKRALAGVTWGDHNHELPINQEDLAYTLLTFGYVIPTGLAKWGREPDREGMEAFLHCWKITGYLMGVNEELMTDDPDEARELFEILVERVRGESEDSIAMTRALTNFLSKYLPGWFGLKTGLPEVMIEDQMGRQDAEMLLGKKIGMLPFTRSFYWLIILFSKLHAVMNNVIYRHSRLLRAFFTDLMHEVGVAFIDSWRGPFKRKPYFIPENLEDWRRYKIDQDYVDRLEKWRRGLFNLLALGLLALMLGSGVILAGIVLALVEEGIGPIEWGLLISVPLFAVAVLLMHQLVYHAIKRRPELHVEGEEAGS